jgi:TRAP-type transport system small permease protein
MNGAVGTMEDQNRDNTNGHQKIFIDHVSYWFAEVGSAIILAAMMCLVTIDVILRGVFSAPISGANDYNCLMMMILVLLSLSYCWTRRGHIGMELVVRKFSKRARDFCWALAALCGSVVFGLMSLQAFYVLIDAIKLHEITFEANVVLWPFRIVFLIGCLEFTIQMIVDFFRYLSVAFRRVEAV